MRDIYFLQPRGEYRPGLIDSDITSFGPRRWRAAKSAQNNLSVIYRIEITNLPFNQYKYSFHFYIGEDEAQALKKLRKLHLVYRPESIKSAYPQDTLLRRYMLDGIGCEYADMEVSSDCIHFDFDLCDEEKVLQLNRMCDEKAYEFAKMARTVLMDLSGIRLDTNKLEKRLWADPITWIVIGVVITAAVLLGKKDVDVKKVEQASRNMTRSISFEGRAKPNPSAIQSKLDKSIHKVQVAQKSLQVATESKNPWTNYYKRTQATIIKDNAKDVKELTKKLKQTLYKQAKELKNQSK